MIGKIAMGLVLVGMAAGVGSHSNSVRREAYGGEWPTPSERDNSVPGMDGGSGTWAVTGARRYSDRGYLISTPSNYGRRFTFSKSFDFTNTWEMTIDFSAMGLDHIALIMFSTTYMDPYINGNGALLSMDVARSSLSSTNYMITLTTGAHNTSIAGTDWPTTPWSGDAAYTGLETNIEDNVVAIKYTIGASNTTVSVNGMGYSIPNSVLWANFPTGTDMSKLYISFGTMNGNDQLDYIDIQKIGDATDEIYYGPEGTYGITLANLVNLEAMVAEGIDTIDKLNAAKAVRDAIVLDALYSHDKNYLNARYTECVNAINAATATLGNEAIIADYADVVNAFDAAANADLTVKNNIDIALSKYNAIAEKKAAVDAITDLTEEQLAQVNALTATVTADYEIVVAAAQTLYKGKTDIYSLACEDINNAEELAAAAKLRVDIPTEYFGFLTAEDQEIYGDKIAHANQRLKDVGQNPAEGWSIGQRGYTIANGDKLGYVSKDGWMGETQLDLVNTNALVYQKEAIPANNFSIEIDVKSWSTCEGAWLSFGIMQNPGYFTAADNDSCQLNLGVFFLLRANVGQSLINIDAYVNTLTCNRFFDAELPTKVDIPFADHLTITFKDVVTEIAGVEETYWVPTFNGVAMDADHVKASTIKTALNAQKTGYFYAASSGANIGNPFVLEITDINGHKPYEASLFPAGEQPGVPTSSEQSDSGGDPIGTSEDPITSEDGGGGRGCGGVIGATAGGVLLLGLTTSILLFARKKKE